MKVLTDSELEDRSIADVIRSLVGIQTRREQRRLQNRITELVAPKVELARLQGRHVDIQAFVTEVYRELSSN